MNIAEACFGKRTVTLGLAAAFAIAGVLSYFKLGRLEDPEYTIRCAQIVTKYPGATAEDVADEVTDLLETSVQRLGCVKHITSTSNPGLSIICVELNDKIESNRLPEIWSHLRHKVNDAVPSLPEGCGTPQVVDDYGDVYGVFYAISGDGFSHAQLKEHAKLLRRELLLCKDVAKVDMIGDQVEAVYLDIPCSRLADLKITPERLRSVLAGQGVPEDAGYLRNGDKEIRIDPTGITKTLEELEDIEIEPKVRIRDVATVTRTYLYPPTMIVRSNGRPAIGLGISTAKGGNVITMGDDVKRRMRELLTETPIGIEIGVISHQATSVETAIDGFVENLGESVVLVIAVLLLTMGLRSGLLIGGVLILTVLLTVFVMDLAGLMFERISLGAFIIALGMLVDNAIVITEAVLVAAQKGESKRAAAIAIVKQTQWSLLGGTAIAILSFAPIGASRNSTGEFCRSLFLVIGISLIISWMLAITVTPLLAEKVLVAEPAGEGETAKDPYGGLFFRLYRATLEWCIDNRLFVLLTLVCLLTASVLGFRFVEQNFFPESTRPQFMVHVWMPEGTRIDGTDGRVRKLAEYAGRQKGVTGVSSFTGAGALRFLLTYTPEDSDSAYGLLLVDVNDCAKIGSLMTNIVDAASVLVPDAEVSCQRFVLGPGEAHKIQIRILGDDPKLLRDLGERAMAVLRADGRLQEVQCDWRNPCDVVRPRLSETRARKLGVNRSMFADAMRATTDGLPVGIYLERDEALPILMRCPTEPYNGYAWSNTGTMVPLNQLMDEADHEIQECRLRRRDRHLCLTVKCNPKEGLETAAAAFERVRPEMENIAKTMPSGYRMEWGGEYENSADANRELVPTFGPILMAMVLTVLMLFNSVKKTAVIFLTLPLIVVGVVSGLLLFDRPFGFMALLGFLSLVGMQVKNAIVLMDEIDANQKRGLRPYEAVVDAGVSRLRPVFNSSITTILGMLPLVADAFYSAMAVTIMIGLAFATVLTMVVIPVNYALLFHVRRS